MELVQTNDGIQYILVPKIEKEQVEKQLHHLKKIAEFIPHMKNSMYVAIKRMTQLEKMIDEVVNEPK